MSERIAAKLATIAVNNGIIKSEDYELYVYSYQILLERTVGWMSILLLSIVFGTLIYTLIFVSFFVTLSAFTGGWHAPSFGLCFVASVGIFLGFSLIEPFITARVSVYVMIGIVICIGIIIGLLGPIADPNKPIDLNNLKKCHKISVVVLCAQIAISFVVLMAGNERTLVFIMFSFVMVCLSLIAAELKSRTIARR